MEPQIVDADTRAEEQAPSSWYAGVVEMLTSIWDKIEEVRTWYLTEKTREVSQSSISTFFLFLVFWVIVYGPTGGWRGPGALSLLVGFILLYWMTSRMLQHKVNGQEDTNYLFKNPIIILQHVLILLLSLIVVLVSESAGLQHEDSLYTHFMIPVIFALVVLPLLFARILARVLYSANRQKLVPTVGGREITNSEWLKKLVECVELVQASNRRRPDLFGLIKSVVNSIHRHLLLVLFLPAFLLLVMPNVLNESLGLVFCVGVLIDLVVLSVASSLGKEHDAVVRMKQLLFHGGQGVVSLLVLILGYGRLFEIGYISTIVEGSPKTILIFIGSAYATFWYFEFWINRILSEEVLAYLKGSGDAIDTASYPIGPGQIKSHVKAEGRVIKIHGRRSKFMVIGHSSEDDGERKIFGRYRRMDLLSYLVENAALDDDLPSKTVMLQVVEEMRTRQRFYFSLLNFVLIGIVLVGIAGLSSLGQVPSQTVIAYPTQTANGNQLDLSKLIFSGGADTPREPVVMIAASGGGTRAALYTTAVLHGLATEELLDNVKLVSGVSGGGTALAYFAANHEALEKSTPDSHLWQQFYDKMSDSFIKEVLENSAEVRLIGSTRLGILLDESFQRRLGHSVLGDVRDVGIIFNTALAGSLQRLSGQGAGAESFKSWARSNRVLTRSDIAGNRLIFTNLKTGTAFPASSLAPYELRYVVVNDDSIKLSTAAALNANFPPVFSNAIVDIVDENEMYGTRYWVTDGGAADNRGIISLLLAVQDALEHPTAGISHKPDIHIIVAEASAVTFDYSGTDRGLGTKFGASEKFATRLMQELLADINARYQEDSRDGKVYLHYLEMPIALRTRGGLSTHWMLPRFVRISNPDEPDIRIAKKESKFVSSHTVKKIISMLHQGYDFYPEQPRIPLLSSKVENRTQQVNAWIRKDYDSVWRNMIEQITPPAEDTTSSIPSG